MFLYEEFNRDDVVQSDETRYLRPLEAWVLEASVLFTRPVIDFLIDDLNALESGTPYGLLTQFTETNGDKVVSGVKFNATTTYGGITIAMRVRREVKNGLYSEVH